MATPADPVELLETNRAAPSFDATLVPLPRHVLLVDGDADGWIHTSDIGCVDAEGYLHLVDRKKDMIDSGGVGVYPCDIEEIAARHPAARAGSTCRKKRSPVSVAKASIRGWSIVSQLELPTAEPVRASNSSQVHV